MALGLGFFAWHLEICVSLTSLAVLRSTLTIQANMEAIFVVMNTT